MSNTTVKANGKANGASTKTAEMTVAKPTPAKRELSVDEIRQRFEDLSILFAKRERLLKSLGKLRSFNMAREENSTALSLTDHEGNGFNTGNVAVVAAVIDLLVQNLEKSLADVEAKIRS